MTPRRPVVAAVTIGQSPRPDIVGDLSGMLPGLDWIEAGVLDGLDQSGIARLAPSPDDVPLVTRAFGGGVIVGEHAMSSHLQAAVDRVSGRADAVVVLCAGEVPALFAPVPIVLPGRLLDGVTAALASGRRLNIFVPHEGQVERQRQRWHARRVPVRVTVVAPHDDTDFEAEGRKAAGSGDFTILDCVGYTCAQQARVRRGTAHPVLSARGVAARVLAELLG